MKTKRGFTLIETVLYIALLGLIIGGAVLTAYSLMEGSDRLDVNTSTQDEGNFVMRKIGWEFSGASSLDSSAPHQLTIEKYDGSTIVIKLLGNEVVLKRGSGAFVPLTTSNVSVSDLVFQDIPAVGSAPEGVKATFTLLGGAVFSTTYYLRQ